MTSLSFLNEQNGPIERIILDDTCPKTFLPPAKDTASLSTGTFDKLGDTGSASFVEASKTLGAMSTGFIKIREVMGNFGATWHAVNDTLDDRPTPAMRDTLLEHQHLVDEVMRKAAQRP